VWFGLRRGLDGADEHGDVVGEVVAARGADVAESA
jgi:hypothetical protein